MRLSRFIVVQLSVFALLFNFITCFFDPISISIAGAAAALGYNFFEQLKEKTYCQLTECCSETHIPGDVKELDANLTRTLFGQHIVLSQLIPVLRSHIKNPERSNKALVMIFHGTPGTGKNFVADRVADHLYTLGSHSKYVHKYFGRADFPLLSRVDEYKTKLIEKVEQAVGACPRTLFIFDEVEKMPENLIGYLSPYLDHNVLVKGVDYRKSIFIFLSNSGGTAIAHNLMELMKSGRLREDVEFREFEQVLEMNAYNQEGGLKGTNLLEQHLIDHFIPFLPLEQRHVEQCIREEFKVRNKNVQEHIVKKIAEKHVIYEGNLFATTGCKRINKWIGAYID